MNEEQKEALNAYKKALDEYGNNPKSMNSLRNDMILARQRFFKTFEAKTEE